MDELNKSVSQKSADDSEAVEERSTLEENSRNKSLLKLVIRYVAITFALFHLYTGFVGPFQGIIQRAIHVGGGLSLFLLMSIDKIKDNKFKKYLNYLLVIITTICCSYVVINFQRIVRPNFEANTFELVLGILMILVVFETTRRMIGLAIPLLSLLAIVYALFGQYFPGTWRHSGVKFYYIVEALFYSDRGIWGSVTGISSTIIAIFIIFGAILFATGGGKAFIDLSSYVVGDSYGGAAKLATVASGLFGTISGSAGANVATTGAFTIPLMKKLGYSADFAAGAECAASTGGQIMPPIMGAGAFIMAELLGISYLGICKAAIIPSLLFYYGVLIAIDCKAHKENYRGVPREQIPKLKSILHYSNSLPIFIPIFVLLFFFLRGYTPVTSAIYAIVSSVVLYLITDFKNIKERIKILFLALEQSSKDMLTVISLIACAQILLCIISLTGIGVKFTNLIISLGGSSILLAGIFAMIATMILGMGLPTVAAYLLGASVLGPALIRLGIPPLAAHFFIFYYSIFSGLTPPVCGTVYIGAAMANSNWLKTAGIAMRLSVGAFIIPFMFLNSSALLLVGSIPEIVRNVVTSTIGITALASGSMGYLFINMNWPIRILMCAIGIMLVDPGLMTDIIGIIGFALILIYIAIKKKNKIEKIEETV